ncbi:hypothetical protein Tco_0783383 [Tanacetum coccineum]
MHPFYPSYEIANSSIFIFPRVKFSSHDPVVHHSGHDIKRRVEVDVSSFLVGKVSKYSTTVSSVVTPSPSSGSSFWGSSSSHMILMNITSPSSSLEQTNFVLGDWGTNLSDSSIEFSLRTCYVAIEANGSGCGCGLELVSPGLSSFCSTSGSLTWDSSGCLGWIEMALIELWICVEHCGLLLGVTKIVLLWLKGIPLTSRFIGTQGCVLNKGLFGVVSEQDQLPSNIGLDFQARLDGGRMYTGHLEAK